MIAELERAGVEGDAGLIRAQRRQREFTTARRFENIAAADLAPLQIASLARNAEFYSARS